MRASEREMRNALEAARQTLFDLGLLELWRESVVERIGRGLRRFTWSSNGIRPGLATGDASVKEYLEFLRGDHYQFLLIDGALIQMSYDFNQGGEIVESRLVWYPCPVNFAREELEYFSIDEIVETVPTLDVNCRGPMRFDYSTRQANENHSTVHLHMGMEAFRLPVQRPLEPSRFIRLIVRTAYPHVWDTKECCRLAEDWGGRDSLNNDDRQIGSINWNMNV